MKLKIKQATENKSPAIAKIVYTTLRGIAMVTVSFLGMPSLGIPSVIGEGEGMGENCRNREKRSYELWMLHSERERMYSCWLTWPYLAPCNPWVVVKNRVWLGYSSHYGHLPELSINSWEKIALLFWIIVTSLWRMNLSVQECIGELKRNQSLVSHPCQMPPHCPSVKNM